MSLLSELKSLTSRKYAGPPEYFDHVHVALLIYYLGEGAPKSRLELSKLLGIGEGSIRTILKRLNESSMINVSRKGVSLSEKGTNFFKALRKTFPIIVEDIIYPLAPAKYNVAILAKDRSGKVLQGIEQRDQAIKYGAKGAVTLLYEKGRFIFPGTKEVVEELYPSMFWSKIKSLGKPEDGDVLIICFAEEQQKAFLGCFAAALTLCN